MIESPEVINHIGSERIQVNIAHKFFKVGVFLADNGFIPVLKKLPMTPVTVVKADRISGQKSAHQYSKPLSEKKWA